MSFLMIYQLQTDDKSLMGGLCDIEFHISAFIKRDQPDPWIKDQIKTILLSTISPLQ